MVTFVILSVLSIVIGGLLMAFSVQRPSQLKSWSSAYLVLVEGLIQLGLILSWQNLGSPEVGLALLAFIIFNVGNLIVILGTALKRRFASYSLVVMFGGALLVASMILLLLSVRNLSYSWTFDGLVVLAIIVFVSVPMGVNISRQRRLP